MAEQHEEIDVVEVFVAVEAVGEVVAWVDGGLHVAATGTEEAEVAAADFGGRAVAAEAGDDERHWQIVVKSAE